MASYAISFRIGSKGDYADRYASVVSTIKEASTAGSWEETTSFLLIQSNLTAQGLADHIYFRSMMNAEYDKLLVIDVSDDRYGTRGTIDYPTSLGGFFSPHNALLAALTQFGK